MDKIAALIRNKPKLYLYLSGGYLLIVALSRWLVRPELDALWFLMGGIIGVYFLEAAEMFFALSPSPFRSVVFQVLFSVVTFFVVTSSTSMLGAGLVLSLSLQMLLWQIGEWRVAGSLDRWYRMVAGPVNPATQRMILIGFSVLFFIDTYIVIR